MAKGILDVVKYFARFQYPPTAVEIYTFLPKKTSKKRLLELLHILRGRAVLVNEGERWARKIDKKFLTLQKRRMKISDQKIRKLDLFLFLAKMFPQIRLIGLSGSVAMGGASKGDDIDLFVIAARKRLFTARAICLLLAACLGKRRRRDLTHAPDKICLNLFFDESDLSVPSVKKTAYVAHEILQMKPIINKNHAHERFLKANRWVFQLFPNSRSVVSSKKQVAGKKQTSGVGDFIEKLAKRAQLRLINKHKTSELITPSQLWFFPDDFEHKLR